MDHKYCKSRLWRMWRSPFYRPSCHTNILCKIKLLSQYGNLSLPSFRLWCAKFDHHDPCLRCHTLHGLNMVYCGWILLCVFGRWIHHRQKVLEINGSHSKTIIRIKAAHVKLKHSLNFLKTYESLRQRRKRKLRLWLQKYYQIKQSILGTLRSSLFLWSSFGPVFR